MELTETITKTIAANIASYRKAAGLTQAELADKLGYSDKSVSKWEQGNGVPDIFNLVRIADIFGITVNDLVSEHKEPVSVVKRKWLDFTNKNLITALSVGLCWFIAVVVYVVLTIVFGELEVEWKTWLIFVYAVCATAVIVLVLSCVWHLPLRMFVCVSALIWGVLLSIFLSCLICLGNNYWMIFLIGIPLQMLVFLAFALHRNIRKKQRKQQ